MKLGNVTRIEFEADVWEHNWHQGKDYKVRAIVTAELNVDYTDRAELSIVSVNPKEEN